MKINTSRNQRIRSLFKRTHADAAEGAAIMTSMRGDINSEVLLIAPPPSAEEVEQGTPLSDARGQAFHNLALNYRVSTQDDFLVVAASYIHAKKPSLKQCATVREFIKTAAKEGLFKKYVCVGDLAYQFIFGEGSKGSMQTLVGSTTFVPETNYLPLFVLPSIAPLIPEEPDNWRAIKLAEQAERSFERVLPKLKKFLL